jgi:hypothetical protein
MATKKSVFETLNAINVSEHIEKKNNLSYLSWSFAWSEVKKAYPLTTYKIYENVNGLNYHTDGMTSWVKVGVIIEEMEMIEYLPVMDFRNKSIPLSSLTSMDVNKAIQRALTKAIARHGLGLYIYAGEDLPEVDKPTLITDKQHAEIRVKFQNAGVDYRSACMDWSLKNFSELLSENFDKIDEYINNVTQNATDNN